MGSSKPVVIDLFSGAGGFTLGSYLAGIPVTLAIDNDSDLSFSFASNFPSTKLERRDLTATTGNDILKAAETSTVDLLIGGPPCQGFSVIGRRDERDPRNELLGHFFRLVREIRPKAFLLENVPGLLFPETRRILEGHLDSLTLLFDIYGPEKLDAVDFGAATTRTRMIVCGIAKSERIPFDWADLRSRRASNTVSVREAMSDLVDTVGVDVEYDGYEWASYSRTEKAHSERTNYQRWARTVDSDYGTELARKRVKEGYVTGCTPTVHSAKVKDRFSALENGKTDPVGKYKKLSWDLPAPTLRAGTGAERGSYQSVRPIHPIRPRVITVREAARLQGFPDWFLFHPTKWHSFRMIGNSVSPLFAYAVVAALDTKMGLSTWREEDKTAETLTV